MKIEGESRFGESRETGGCVQNRQVCEACVSIQSMSSLVLLSAELGTSEHDDCQDDTEETKGRSENLDDQNLHEEGGVRGVRQSGTSASNTDRHTIDAVKCKER